MTPVEEKKVDNAPESTESKDVKAEALPEADSKSVNKPKLPPSKPSPAPRKNLLRLPTERTQPKNDINGLTFLLYGDPGIGKTTLLNSFRKPLILATEEGTNHLSAYVMHITSWQDFKDVYTLLEKESHDFETVGIDTIDNLHKLCVEDTCRKRGIEHVGDEDWGKGYDIANGDFSRMLSRYSLLPTGFVMISHAQEKEVKTKTAKIDKTQPTMTGKPMRIITGLADIVGYACFDPENAEKRIVKFKGSETLVAKDRTGRLPAYCDLGYDAIASHFSS